MAHPTPRPVPAGCWSRSETETAGSAMPPFDTLNVSRSVGDAGQAATNRKRVAASLGVDVESLAFVKQVHGADVLEAPPGCSGVQGEGDGLVSHGSWCGVRRPHCRLRAQCCSRDGRGSPDCMRDGEAWLPVSSSEESMRWGP